MTAAVPRRPSDITAAWMSEALGTDVADVDITKTIGGTATKLLLRVTYTADNDLPETMCLKGGMGDHAPFMAQVGIYDTEGLFFRDELKQSKVRDPKRYWADVDDERSGAGLIEDLRRSSVWFCPGRTPLEPSEVAAVLD